MRNQKLTVVSMIRNEADIIVTFLNHAATLFDKIKLVDIQSTDGTTEIIRSIAATSPDIEVFTCKTQEKYQSEMMTLLARRAVDEGADWVFFLDADEFVNIENKAAFQSYVNNFSHDVMHLAWVNLIPTSYGQFDAFDINQEYFWRGRVSPYRKVALSGRYINFNPDFLISEGNHLVSARLGEKIEEEHIGLSLLHVPVRSAERLKYKMASARRLLLSKAQYA